MFLATLFHTLRPKAVDDPEANSSVNSCEVYSSSEGHETTSHGSHVGCGVRCILNQSYHLLSYFSRRESSSSHNNISILPYYSNWLKCDRTSSPLSHGGSFLPSHSAANLAYHLVFSALPDRQ